MQLRNRGELYCHCCTTRCREVALLGLRGLPPGRIAHNRGICNTCREWLRQRIRAGWITDEQAVERGIMLPKKPLYKGTIR